MCDGKRFIALNDDDTAIAQLQCALDASVWLAVRRARSILRNCAEPAHHAYETLTSLPHVRTLGIETRGTAARVESLWRSTFEVWDFAGRIEFFPIHHIADGDGGGINVILFDASRALEPLQVEKEARRWFDFVVVGRRHWLSDDRAHVVLLLTHIDSIEVSSPRVAQVKAAVERLAGTAPFVDKFVLLGNGAQLLDYRNESSVAAVKALLFENARKNRRRTLGGSHASSRQWS